MARCLLCPTMIDAKNDSGEHLINNALGGRVKVGGILCEVCNAKSGHKWDAELARQLNPLCLLLGISRDRNRSPSQPFATAGGNTRLIHADGTSSPGKPVFSEQTTDRGIEVRIVARTKIEARRMLQGVHRKYPHIDIDKIAETMESEHSYDDDPLQIQLQTGGPSGGRSIVKSALVCAVRKGIDPGICTPALTYLKGDDSFPPFGYYYRTDLVRNRPTDRVFHCVAIQGDARSGLLVGYVEYFSAFRMIVLLSDRYTGPDIEDHYAVNPVNGEKIRLEFNLTLSQEEIDATFRYECAPEQEMQSAFDLVMQLSQNRSFNREKERVISDAVEYAFKHCGVKPGGMITAEHISILSSLIVGRMQPFLRQHLQRRQLSPTR